MKNFLLRLLISAVAVLVVASILSGIHLAGFVNAIIVAAVLAVLNAVLKPLLVILTIPVTVMTLGLFLLVINTLMVLLAAWLIPQFQVDGFWWALLFSVLLSVINSVFFSLIGD